jgi:PPOX class probable F420-dependent enzyme
MPTPLNEGARNLLDGKNFAVVATLNPDGSPHTSIVWVARRDDTVVLTTTTARKKGRNLARDPRVSISVFNANNPYETVEIRGTAELIDDPAKLLPKELSQKYLGEDPPPEPANVRRVIVQVTPGRVINLSV